MFNTADCVNFMLRNVLSQAYQTFSETHRDQCRCVLSLAHPLHDVYLQAGRSDPDVSVEGNLLEGTRCYTAVTESLRTDISLQPLHVFRGTKRLSENLDDSPVLSAKKKEQSDDSCVG